MNFEKRVVLAALFAERGDPIKDVLDEEEVVDAVKRLADVYVALGVVNIADIEEQT